MSSLISYLQTRQNPRLRRREKKMPEPTTIKVKGDTKSSREESKLPRESWLSEELFERIISLSDVMFSKVSSPRISLVFIMLL